MNTLFVLSQSMQKGAQGVPTSLPEHNGVSPTGPPGTELKNFDPAGNYQLIGQGYWDTLYPLGPSFVA